MNAQERIQTVREKISSAAARSGRDGSAVRLVGVTKTRTVEEMLDAVPWIDAIGENRVQEAASKKEIWPSSDAIEWRLIGHLQSNKARKALSIFDTVDSLDSSELARTLNRIAHEMGRTVPVLIEVNTSGEASKTGVAPKEFFPLLDEVLSCPRLVLQGLMTIGPLTDDESRVREAFAELRNLNEAARIRSGSPLPVLSMGMSGDFEWAVEEGSTVVRIGTLLFGPR